jgi:hypothetical protein
MVRGYRRFVPSVILWLGDVKTRMTAGEPAFYRTHNAVAET